MAAFYELVPLGTEGREPAWFAHATPWKTRCRTASMSWTRTPVLQLYAQDEPSFDQYMQTLRDYVQPRARGTAFTEFYHLRFFGHHLRAVAKPGGLFEDTVVGGCAGAARRGGAHGGSSTATGRQAAAARRPSRC